MNFCGQPSWKKIPNRYKNTQPLEIFVLQKLVLIFTLEIILKPQGRKKRAKQKCGDQGHVCTWNFNLWRLHCRMKGRQKKKKPKQVKLLLLYFPGIMISRITLCIPKDFWWLHLVYWKEEFVYFWLEDWWNFNTKMQYFNILHHLCAFTAPF